MKNTKIDYDKEFGAFWNRCIDRCEYMEKHVDGETTLTSNLIACVYEATKMIINNMKKGKNNHE